MTQEVRLLVLSKSSAFCFLLSSHGVECVLTHCTPDQTQHSESNRASGDLLHDAGSSNLLLRDKLEVWDEVGGGREDGKGGDF